MERMLHLPEPSHDLYLLRLYGRDNRNGEWSLEPALLGEMVSWAATHESRRLGMDKSPGRRAP